jgi:hypothetical protein
MKLTTVLGAIGSGAAVFKTASSMALVIGTIYLLDCRLSNRGPDSMNQCWMTALPIMGVGAAGRGGFSLGWNTYNPALRPENGPGASTTGDRDESGRFKRRQP